MDLLSHVPPRLSSRNIPLTYPKDSGKVKGMERETCPNCGAVRFTYKGVTYGSWNYQTDHYGRRTERICTHLDERETK